MDPPGGGVHAGRQGVGVGRLQLAHCPVLQDELGQLVLEGELLQHRFRRGGLALGGLGAHRQPELVVEDGLDLLRGPEVERPAGAGVGRRLDLAHPSGELGALGAEEPHVHPHPVALDPREHRHQRHLHLVAQRHEGIMGFEPRAQRPVQAQGDVGVLGRIRPRVLDRDLVERELLRALAGDVLVVDGAMPEVLQRQRIHVVAGGGAVEHVGFEHGVERGPGERDPGARKHAHVVLEVLADLRRPFGFQDRAQLREHRLARDLVRRPRVVVPEGDVGGVPGRDGERHPHQLRPHVVEARGLGVEGDLRGGPQALDPGVEGGFVEHRLVLGLQGLDRRPAVRAEQLPEPGLELQLPVERLQRLHVRLAERQIEGTGIEGHVAADRHQLLRERDAVDARPQVLPHLALDLAGMGDEGVERAVLRQPLRRGLRPHLRDPGDVVHRIADQRQVIDDGLRRHAELGLHPGRVEDRPVHGVDHGDPIVHELGPCPCPRWRPARRAPPPCPARRGCR